MLRTLRNRPSAIGQAGLLLGAALAGFLLARARHRAAVHRQEETRSRLLTNVIHELGRPLAALRAATSALLDGAAGDPPLAAELLQGMDGEIVRMAGLLDELTALRERTAGPLALALRPVDLNAWLPAVLAPWAAAASAAGLRWTTDLTGLEPDLTEPDLTGLGDLSGLPQARIDPDRLAAALGNLLSNAVKFTPRGGAVTVTSGVGADGWYCRVTDTGPGIAADDQARIFEPFARVPAGRRYPPGLGLGLAIARDIVQAHGGALTVASEPGAGATFTVRIQT